MDEIKDQFAGFVGNIQEMMEQRTGATQLAGYLQDHGIPAHVAKRGSEEWFEKGGVQQDAACIKITGRKVSHIAIRISGFGGQSSKTSAGVGPVKVSHTYSLNPIQYHHIVPVDPSYNPKSYKASLKLRTKGLFKKEILGYEWKGGRLAEFLSRESATTRGVTDGLGDKEKFWIEPDPKGGCVRIVHSTWIEVEGTYASIIEVAPTQIRPVMPSLMLLDAIERVAGKVIEMRP